jgi:predicted DNA-binding transcriptional regulator AlpA
MHAQKDYEKCLRDYLATVHPCSSLTMEETCKLLKKSKAWVYAKFQDSPANKYFDREFPRPCKYSDKGSAIFFLEREVVSWMLARISVRNMGV